ncbi:MULTISPECIES: endonuclease/exonuclease/phosphatase family protein [unclassified Nocardioides]|uniref:endonuclease/exonuclease/phosphatase family protein n=1 Tax=unclassified Nocardioides TaxID=2615069 RepID=UPI0007037C1F|nr:MULTISPECIES: endonuclease/exonuclease/phosphatase family protein [unclassified Nocardioides]KRC53066.1 endonuclease [Nocardioides sp. Root79]KRC72595.1 endonuclease [Nocardioides sp. Root240]
MRIVSVNAWGGARYDDLAAWLPTTGADVVCLQEVTRTPDLGGWTRFEDEARVLPQRADLMADVEAALPAHDGWFTVSDSGPVTDDAGAVHRQHFGLGMLTGPTTLVVAARAAYVHGRYADHGDAWPASNRPRAAQVARFEQDGRFLTLGHLHGLRDDTGKGDSPARRAQAERLAELVEDVREPGDLVVVCGDLNLLPDSETFAVLAGIGLTDLVGTADTRTSSYPKPVRHASYLLVSDPAAVRDFRIIAEPEVSDHRALQVDL